MGNKKEINGHHIVHSSDALLPSNLLLKSMKQEIDKILSGGKENDISPKGYRESLANTLAGKYNKRRGK